MKKQFTIWQLYAVTHGILSTSMEDVYLMLNHITDCNLYTHQLPTASRYVESKNPSWYVEAKQELDAAISQYGSDFSVLREVFEHTTRVFEVPQLKDEFDTADFKDYMVNNSLLLNRN